MFFMTAAWKRRELRADLVSETIQNIVNAYVKLDNAEALEALKAHRQKLVIGFDGRDDYNFELLLGQLRDEIDQIEAGLEKVRQPNGTSPV